MLNSIERFGDKLENLINKLITPIYVALVFIVFMQVVCRYILKIPFSAANELSLYSFVWIVYLTAAFSVRQRAHFRVEVLPAWIQKTKFHKAYSLLINLLMACMALAFVVYGSQAAILGIDRSSPGSSLPLIYTNISVPISGVLMLFFLFLDSIKVIKE